jgi:phosphomannomutase
MNLKNLQNGSDIRGVALEGVAGENVNLTAEVIKTIGSAFVRWFENQFYAPSSVAIGMDSRLSGPALKNALVEAVTALGVDVYDCGLSSTPAMFMTTLNGPIMADAAIMLTASHLPFNRNGMKFFTMKGGVNKQDVTEIILLAENQIFLPAEEKGKVIKVNFLQDYAQTLVEYIRKNVEAENYNYPLQGFRIIVDAGNGAGGFFASRVLKELGADTQGSQFLDPDGLFPNHVPNPEDPDAMQSICDAVLSSGADLGIIFDTDVDRAAIVDSRGNPVNRNELIALMAAIVLEEYPQSVIVTDSVTSEGLAVFIHELGGEHHRYRRGYKNVINEAIKINASGKKCHLAIETSGHAAFKENHFLDDGAFLIAKVLVKMAQMKLQGKDLFSLINKLRIPVESTEMRFKIKTADFATYGAAVIEHLRAKAMGHPGWEIQQPNYEGLRVKCNNADEQGWFLIRMSLHDPVLPLNIESDVAGGASAIAARVKEMLAGFENL